MAQTLSIAIIILCYFALNINGQNSVWKKPYFKDAHVKGINLNIATSTLKVEEELNLPFKLVYINYHMPPNDEGIQPRIGNFLEGSDINLNPLIKYDKENGWYIEINTRQDYEQKNQRLYIFNIYIGSETGSIKTEPQDIYLTIELVNIFDNNPVVAYNGPCQAKELEENVLTNCIFSVFDLDGLQNNEITIDIDNKNNENDFFELVDQTQMDAYTYVYTLKIKNQLEYDKKSLHNFDVIAHDKANNPGNLSALLTVINVPHKLPKWVQPLFTATFNEKTEKKFDVQAIDGDTGINAKICYKLQFNENEDYSDIMKIISNNGIGKLYVAEINRDIRQQDIFHFSICAFKCDTITSEICSNTIFIIKDINDNLPTINIVPNEINIPENKAITIPSFDVKNFTFNVKDIDLGIHASYDITLEKSDNANIDHSIAYDVIPKSGYQNSSFKLIVSNEKYLDYEDDSWRNTVIKVIARETEFPDNYTFLDLRINLINWNDEYPIFTENDYTVKINETVGKNTRIKDVIATDRDISDFVIHTILGEFDGIKIDENGTVYTTRDDVFDYNRQHVIIIQIKATDTLTTPYSQKLNEAITQLTINLIDINNKPPEIRMPRTTPNITENSPGGTLITDLILGTDPDTSANLTFEIDWDKTYATKAGREATKSTYENCFILEAHPHNNSNTRVYGHLKVNPDFIYQVDYEEYENIYLLIRIIDWGQEINDNYSEGTLTVTVLDENDNPPRFIKNTLNDERFVVEEAAFKTLVGTIFAEDIDGPDYNKISYEIKPVYNTAEGLIEIQPNGVLQVMDKKIDCDIPKIDYLFYNITLTDGLYITEGSIKINVTDINNKFPQVGEFEDVVYILENSTTGTYVGRIPATDADRDPPHNVLRYIINTQKSPELNELFKIDKENGSIRVELGVNAELDRDNGKPEHIIDINIEDNYLDPSGDKHSVSTKLKVVLIDVNDNAPEMPDSNNFLPKISENAKSGDYVSEQLYAPDNDEPDTNNSWVSYKILSIKRGKDCNQLITDYDNLWGITDVDKKYGHIYAGKDLQGYYGSWYVHIEAYDHGDEPMSSNETYIIKVNAENFNEPKIKFPTDNIIRLSHKQNIGKPLINTGGTELKQFEAFDPDGDEYGNIKFQLTNYRENDSDYFEIVYETRNKSRLQITKSISPKLYAVNLKATDGGGKYDELKNLKILFIDMNGDPIFDNNTFITNFTETELGLKEERVIQNAIDPKNQGITNPNDLFKIYYFIDYNQNKENSSLFKLNSENGTLTLKEKLNRTAIDQHTFRIIATNKEDEPPTNPNPRSILQVIIDVNDVNDNPPVFDDRKYGTGITTKDYVKKEIIKVHATDPDLDDPTTYFINSPIVAHGNNIEEVKNKIFQLNNDTRAIILMMVPKDNMKGYFEFNITAIDTANHTDEANVKIYIIGEDNRIEFIFLSPYDRIKAKEIFLRETLEKEYGYDRCNIDGIEYTTQSTNPKQSTDNSTASTESVSVKVHFIKNNEAIEATEIQKKSDKNLILKLKATFNKVGLYLDNIAHSAGKEIEQNLEDLLITMLVVVSVVLGTLCMVLVIAFFLKTRAIKRLLKAYEPTEFGSRASNLNRIGAPTTNVFSVEGSNPVINNTININDDFETSSIDSDGSDFVGINNDPNFIVGKESKSSKNSSLISNYESNASNTKHSFSDNDQQIYDNRQKYSSTEINDMKF